jgi:hypothetical protein
MAAEKNVLNQVQGKKEIKMSQDLLPNRTLRSQLMGASMQKVTKTGHPLGKADERLSNTTSKINKRNGR